MQSTQIEALELQLATLRAAILAHSPLTKGDRVTFLDANGVQHYGTVEAIGTGIDGLPVAGLRMAGMFHLWAEPMVNLARVCGVCVDCRAINVRPFCMSAAGASYWRKYEQAGRVLS